MEIVIDSIQEHSINIRGDSEESLISLLITTNDIISIDNRKEFIIKQLENLTNAVKKFAGP